MAASGCNSFFERCDQAFNPHIPYLHPAEVMKRLDRNMYACGASAVLFGALLVVSAVLGHSGMIEGVLVSGMGASIATGMLFFYKRLQYSNLIKKTSFDLNGFDTRYRFADIKKDLGVLFLGHRAIVPIMVPMRESTPQDESNRS